PWNNRGPLLLAVLFALFPSSVLAEPAGSLLAPNGDFETDANADGWPDGWASLSKGGAWVEEQGNHFLRLSSTAPGEMVMLYQEIRLPADVEAITLRWRQRVSGLKVGKQAWFDARIMLEFSDADRKKVVPSPSAPYARRDTEGWVEKKIAFLVPEGAVHLKFMPALFQVNAGTLDLDNVELRATDPAPLREQAAAAAAARQAKWEAEAHKRRTKAAA